MFGAWFDIRRLRGFAWSKLVGRGSDLGQNVNVLTCFVMKFVDVKTVHCGVELDILRFLS